jgi:hypothetical protein
VLVVAATCAFGFKWPPGQMSALSGIELAVSSILLLPWCFVFGRHGLVSYAPTDPGYGAWRALSIGVIPLLVGQVAAFAPTFIDLGLVRPWSIAVGQLSSSVFRVMLCWALWRVRCAYLGTGLGFHLTVLDRILAIIVSGASLIMIGRHDVLGAYWNASNASVTSAVAYFLTATQVLNYLLYPAVFFTSLTMYRYAAQMKGGHIAAAWRAIAAYGLLQPLHVFLTAIFYQYFGLRFALAVDNFVVLGAYASLALGAVLHAEIAAIVLERQRTRAGSSARPT